MKRILATIIITLCLISTTAAQQSNEYLLPSRGYGGDGSLALGFAISSAYGARPLLDLSTTHGYWFSPRFHLGGGLSTINTQYLTLYAQVLWTLRRPTERQPSYPIMALKTGYSVSTWVGEEFADHTGFYCELKFGWSFYSRAGNLRYNVFAAAHMFSFKVRPKIGIAFEF